MFGAFVGMLCNNKLIIMTSSIKQRHLLTELYARRQSLSMLVQWFRHEWKRIESQLAESALPILKHAMENMLRMSDGLIFLTSGECRHPYDIEEARNTKYKSKLSTLKERGDGYTCLYKSNAIYSGFGWDEFANETVGIQARGSAFSIGAWRAACEMDSELPNI